MSLSDYISKPTKYRNINIYLPTPIRMYLKNVMYDQCIYNVSKTIDAIAIIIPNEFINDFSKLSQEFRKPSIRSIQIREETILTLRKCGFNICKLARQCIIYEILGLRYSPTSILRATYGDLFLIIKKFYNEGLVQLNKETIKFINKVIYCKL